MDILNPSQSQTTITLDFCKKLPKIELHAHLNGSIRLQTLKELSLKKGFPFAFEEHSTRDLKACFSIFAQIHKVLIELDAIRRVTREMLQDFQLQNVVYLEIRTTPKNLEGVFTYEEYLEAILDEIMNFNEQNKMIIRILFSVDRSRSIEQAKKTVELLKKYKSHPLYSSYILGFDYSGNPYQNSFRDFKEIFENARNNGFKTMIHIAETEGEDCKKESSEILEFGPDRLGHFNYFDEKLLEMALKKKIPLEICPSSNVCTLGLKSLKEHHFGVFLKEKYPMSICTDDTGVFDTDLSKELYEMFRNFEMNVKEVKEFLLRSLECVLEEEVRKKVEPYFLKFFQEFE